MTSNLDHLIKQARDYPTTGTADALAMATRNLHAALCAEVRARHLREAIALIQGCWSQTDSYEGSCVLDNAEAYLATQLPALCSEALLAEVRS